MHLSQLRAMLAGRYDIERELGRGGMGAVYLARDAAKLSGPEIPLAIRLLQQDLASLSMVLVFGAVFFWVLRLLLTYGEEDVPLLMVILISVLFTRVMQAMREVARVADLGFSASDISAGPRAVMAERDLRRTELKQDAKTRRARKRTLIAGGFQLAMAIAFFAFAMQHRFPQTDGTGYYVDRVGGIFVLFAMVFFGVSFALLLRSPFRQSIGEWMYRLFWTGALGRAFIRMSGRKSWRPDVVTARRSGGVSGAHAVRSATRGPAGVVAPDRIEALERRVSDLERWKKESR